MTIRTLVRLPRLPGAKYITHTLRATEAEHKLHKEAAAKAGLTFSAWATTALNRAAQRTLNPKTKENNGTSV